MSLVHRTRAPRGEPAGALVLFHGRGADELDLAPLLDVLDPERRLLGVTPRAPLSLPPGGWHWYVVHEVGYPDPSTFLPTFARAGEWLDGFLAESGLPIESTVLGGFSQGAVMAYALALGRGRPRPAGVVAFSGFIPTVAGFEADLDGALPPVAIGHGTFDPVIGVGWGRQARERLERARARVVYRESPLPHTIDVRFATELASWISDAVAAGRAGATAPAVAEPRTGP